jgi:hypothetical protein
MCETVARTFAIAEKIGAMRCAMVAAATGSRTSGIVVKTGATSVRMCATGERMYAIASRIDGIAGRIVGTVEPHNSQNRWLFPFQVDRMWANNNGWGPQDCRLLRSTRR